jgi:OMF family outer membrane factor
MKLVSIHKLLLLVFLQFGSIAVWAQPNWSLQKCLDTALILNKQIRIGKNNVSQREELLKEAKAQLLPKINLNADYRYYMDLPTQLLPLNIFNPQVPEGEFKEAQFGVPHTINAQLLVQLPLYSPQTYGAIKQADLSAKMADLQVKKSEEQILYEISGLYYNAQILQHQLEFLDSNLLNSSKLKKNITLLNEQLLATGTDLRKVFLQDAQLQTKRELVQVKLVQVLEYLKLLMGVPLTTNFAVEPIQYSETGPDYDELTPIDVKLIQQEKRLLEMEISTLNKSRKLPSVHLQVAYGSTGFGYHQQPSPFLKFYPIGYAGIQFSYPIFDGTISKRKISKKQLELSNNQLQEALITDKIKAELNNSSRRKQVTQKTILMSREQLDLAKAIYEQTLLQHKQGLANLTDILLADNAVLDAQQQLLSTWVDLLKMELELKKLTSHLR